MNKAMEQVHLLSQIFRAGAEKVSAVVTEVHTMAEAMAYAVALCERKQACRLLLPGCEAPLSDAAEALCGRKNRKLMAAPLLYLRHLPLIFAREHNYKALPAIAQQPFRDRWEKIKPRVSEPRFRVALFSGCVQDFVYPEQLEAAVRLLADRKIALEFPMDQSCCGLPVAMMAEKQAARDVARQNVKAFDPNRYDAIVTLCASCASHLKQAYPGLLAGDVESAGAARDFAAKVTPFSVFMDGLGEKECPDNQSGRKATFHAPCHLCRGLGVTDAPRRMIRKAGFEYVPAEEELTCCGFGGTYSGKFPEISARILDRKLADVRKTGADLLVTECPGCVMQLRGGAVKRNQEVEVIHLGRTDGPQQVLRYPEIALRNVRQDGVAAVRGFFQDAETAVAFQDDGFDLVLS
jgi:Fe-S oxidoreductase